MTEPITLFFLVERVSRLREAQRRCDDLNSEYNRRQMLPLAHEVDSLLVRANKIKLYPDFLRFVHQCETMRKAQGQFGMVADAERLKLEISVDMSVENLTSQAKFLNEQLKAHNIGLDVPVMPNNRQKKGGRQ